MWSKEIQHLRNSSAQFPQRITIALFSIVGVPLLTPTATCRFFCLPTLRVVEILFRVYIFFLPSPDTWVAGIQVFAAVAFLNRRTADDSVSLSHTVMERSNLLEASDSLLACHPESLCSEDLLGQIIALFLRLLILLKTRQTRTPHHATQSTRPKSIDV